VERTFGQALKDYRLKRGWTLQQIADITGRSLAGISMIEREKVAPQERTKAIIKSRLPNLMEEL
tara:strand:- start:2498 stop:2689 length:192 start_codon:yes stop_codon:yes gene_type:complete